jgi:hypothetical protein
MIRRFVDGPVLPEGRPSLLTGSARREPRYEGRR